MKNQKELLVSIIVPVYNITPYIEDCIESIQNQTYSNIEILVVDDGSTDGSGELCEKLAAHDKRIKLIRQKNMGVAAARGRGIENASGVFLMFVDGDDWIEPDMTKELVKQLGHGDLATSGVYYQEAPDKVKKRKDEFPERSYPDKQQLNTILESMIYDENSGTLHRLTPWCFNKLYRSELVKEVYRKVDLNITFAEDCVFLYQYLLKCRSVTVTHKCYYHYRYRAGSAMHAYNPHMLMDINRVYLALESDFRKHELGPNLLAQLQKWILHMNWKAINEFMGLGDGIHMTEYIADLSCLEGKEVVLYGAGNVGRDTYAQMQGFGYHIALWADKNYVVYQEKGMPVEAPEKICRVKYDVIYIAVNSEDLAEKIKKDLSGIGIAEHKMLWRKPMHVF